MHCRHEETLCAGAGCVKSTCEAAARCARRLPELPCRFPQPQPPHPASRCTRSSRVWQDGPHVAGCGAAGSCGCQRGRQGNADQPHVPSGAQDGGLRARGLEGGDRSGRPGAGDAGGEAGCAVPGEQAPARWERALAAGARHACTAAQIENPYKAVLYEQLLFSNIDDRTGQVLSTIVKKVRMGRGRRVPGARWHAGAPPAAAAGVQVHGAGGRLVLLLL